MILKIANIISLLLAEAWLIKSPDWEPAILFISLLGGLIAQEFKSIQLNGKTSKKKEKLEALYTKVHEMMEELIKVTKTHQASNDLNSQFSKLTAEVTMLASPSIIKQYNNVANLYDEWASIYTEAYPKAKNGIQIIYSSGMDPTKKYKKLENDTYQKFYQEYENLIKLMRSEIQKRS